MVKKHDIVLYDGERHMVKSVGMVYATIYPIHSRYNDPFRVKIEDLKVVNPVDVEDE